MKELDGLIKSKTWKFVCREKVPPDTDILTGPLVLAINDEGTKKILLKERFAVQGHKHGKKQPLVQNT